MIYESAGMHASLLGACLESLVIDNDAIGGALRTVAGIKVDEDSLSLEAIRDVCTKGPGHFLGHAQTLDRMQAEYTYPVVGDRTSPKEWVEIGSPSIIDRAEAKVKEILSTHYPRTISESLDKELRDRFPIRLDRAKMAPS